MFTFIAYKCLKEIKEKSIRRQKVAAQAAMLVRRAGFASDDHWPI